MKSTIYFTVGLAAGILLTWYYFNRPGQIDWCRLSKRLGQSEHKIDSIPYESAMKWYCNYLSKTDRLCSSIDTNTRYMNISNKELLALFCRYEKEYEGFAGIRIYPMIYGNDCDKNRANRVNMLIVPLKDSIGNWELKDLEEMHIPNSSSNKLIYYSLLFSADNQVGQCPPGTCYNNGAKLLNDVSAAMAGRFESDGPTTGVDSLKPNCDGFKQ